MGEQEVGRTLGGAARGRGRARRAKRRGERGTDRIIILRRTYFCIHTCMRACMHACNARVHGYVHTYYCGLYEPCSLSYFRPDNPRRCVPERTTTPFGTAIKTIERLRKFSNNVLAHSVLPPPHTVVYVLLRRRLAKHENVRTHNTYSFTISRIFPFFRLFCFFFFPSYFCFRRHPTTFTELFVVV